MNYEEFCKTYDGVDKNIFLINMSKEDNHHFAEITLKWIRKYLEQGKKIAILVNKKWYSNGILCRDCGYVPQCKKCSVSIWFHKIENDQKIGICHVCKTQYSVPTKCDECGSANIKEFGMWTQKVADYIYDELWQKSLIIESNSVNSVKKIQDITSKIDQHQIIIGTSLLSTPIQNKQFDLVVFLSADLGLNIPDFSANENNFWFLYSTFTKHKCANFLVQTFNPNHYSIRNACKLDKEWFFEIENRFRQKHNYPPFAEMSIIMYKNETESKLFNKVDKLYKELLYLQEKYKMKDDLEIYSTPPLVYKIFGKYRYNIIIKWKQVRNFMDIVYSKLNIVQKWFKIDPEPINLI